MTDTVVSDLAYCVNKKFNDSQMYIVQYSTIDRNNGHLTSYDNYIVQMPFFAVPKISSAP